MIQRDAPTCIICGKVTAEAVYKSDKRSADLYGDVFSHWKDIPHECSEAIKVVKCDTTKTAVAKKAIEDIFIKYNLSDDHINETINAIYKEKVIIKLTKEIEKRLKPKYMNTHFTWAQVKQCVDEIVSEIH